MNNRGPVPNALDVQEAAAHCGISADTLTQWTNSGHAPHYTIEGNGPFYRRTDIAKWVRENLVKANAGFPIPSQMSVLQPIGSREDVAIPASLCGVSGLQVVTVCGHCPGVYFLCDGGEVVYVGQSTSVVNRVVTHAVQGLKVFDKNSVLYLPCPAEQLDAVEARFIDLLRPKYNWGKLRDHYFKTPLSESPHRSATP